MTYQFTISLQDLLTECIAQTAVDFTAVRCTNPAAADAVCDDFMLSTDRSAEVSTQISSLAAILEARLGARMIKQDVNQDEIEYQIEGGNNAFSCGVVNIFVHDYFKYNILAWWYTGRNEALSEKYTLNAMAICEELKGRLVPKFYERKLRYF